MKPALTIKGILKSIIQQLDNNRNNAQQHWNEHLSSLVKEDEEHVIEKMLDTYEH